MIKVDFAVGITSGLKVLTVQSPDTRMTLGMHVRSSLKCNHESRRQNRMNDEKARYTCKNSMVVCKDVKLH